MNTIKMLCAHISQIGTGEVTQDKADLYEAAAYDIGVQYHFQ